jgi:hypothetical protein
MARLRALRRTGPIGLALAAWDIWRRIPPRHRKMIVKQARKHGPRLAAKALKAQQRRRRPGP